MTFFEKELHRLFDESECISADAVFAGKTMIAPIGEDLRAKVQFVYTNTHAKYDALRLTIINRHEGTVDSETFKFKDIRLTIRVRQIPTDSISAEISTVRISSLTLTEEAMIKRTQTFSSLVTPVRVSHTFSSSSLSTRECRESQFCAWIPNRSTRI